jgi:imidazolonepropionase-like amidohydrolase
MNAQNKIGHIAGGLNYLSGQTRSVSRCLRGRNGTSNAAFHVLKAAVVLGGIMALLPGCSPKAPQKIKMPFAGTLRLDGVTIVDTENGALAPGMSILMDRGRIVRISATAVTPADPSVRSVNAAGKFVVPGYNNMHSHVLAADNASGAMAMMLTEGVTGFRQMSGSPELLKARRDGTLPMGNNAPGLLAMPGNLLLPFNTVSLKDTDVEIRQQKQDGADFIKIGLVSPAVFFEAIAEAKRVGLPALGHLQEGVETAQASRAGFRSIEHLGPGDALWTACSTQETALLADALRHPPMKAPPFRIPAFVQTFLAARMHKLLICPTAFEAPADAARLQRAFDTYSEQKCHALAALFVADDTWNVPTLVRLKTQEFADAEEYQRDPYLPYIPEESVKEWREVTDRFRKLPAAMHATFHEAYGRQLALTKLFSDSGVPMMTGTDGSGQAPGQSLAQEFDELAEAGLSPLKILQMTTLYPARFLGRTADMGRVVTGTYANLVLLDADPTASVQNMHRIAGVVRGGVYLSRGDLDALAARVAAGHGFLH